MRQLITLLLTLIQVYYWLIIVRVLLSWIPLPQSQAFRTIYRVLYQITEPYLKVFRRIIPSLGSGGIGLDISPLLAVFVLFLVQSILGRLR